jgi:hypothetical protein
LHEFEPDGDAGSYEYQYAQMDLLNDVERRGELPVTPAMRKPVPDVPREKAAASD